jgi:SAM-dependent methyltransferase
MFKLIEEINSRPRPFQFYTAEKLWTDEHTSKQMLQYHLNESIDVSSKNKEFIDHSVEWIHSYFRVNHSTAICDFGCGPGLYTTPFAQLNAKVTGIDFSRRSISYAKKVALDKKLDIDYVTQNYLTFETPKKFDLITMIMCDYCALSSEQRRNLLKKFYQILKPEGSILLDVYSLNAFNQREEQAVYELNLLNGFWSPEDYYGFLNTFKYDDEKVILDKYTIVKPNRIDVVYNWLQCFSRESLAKEFESNGFKIEKIFSDVAGSEFEEQSTEFAVIARKVN